MKIYYRSEISLRVFCCVLIFTAGCANQTQQVPEKSLFIESAKTDFAHLPKDVIAGAIDTISDTNNVIALMLAGGATVAMNQGYDKQIAGYFERHEIFHGFTDRGFKTLGNPGYHFAGAGIWYLLSAENQDDFNKSRAWTMITALSVNSLATVGLKAIRNDDTPFGNRWAWPSGHTSSSFTVASVLDEFYGHEVGYPAYAVASLVGLRMMDSEDHWGSDVVFGAVLGWVIGHTIARKHKKFEIANFEVNPYLNPESGGMGLSLTKRF